MVHQDNGKSHVTLKRNKAYTEDYIKYINQIAELYASYKIPFMEEKNNL